MVKFNIHAKHTNDWYTLNYSFSTILNFMTKCKRIFCHAQKALMDVDLKFPIPHCWFYKCLTLVFVAHTLYYFLLYISLFLMYTFNLILCLTNG